MAWKVIKGILLAALMIFYAKNIYDGRKDWYEAIVLNRVNFITLVAILALLSDYIKRCATLCMFVLVGGILFHGYMYFKVYVAHRNADNVVQQQAGKCSGKGWYAKLNGKCY